MEFQGLSVVSKLDDWIKNYRRMLGDRIIDYAIDLGEKCVLACSTISQPRDEPSIYPLPNEAVLEITKFGHRLRGRPSTARPFYWAAYLLREVLTDQSEAVCAYLDALLDQNVTSWEFRKHLADCSKRAKRGAKKVQDLELKGKTLEMLETEIQEAKKFVRAAKKEKSNDSGGLEWIVRKAQFKKELFEKIQSGFFESTTPHVFVRSSRSVGTYKFEGEDFTIKENCVSFEIFPKGISKPLKWASIMVLPVWYDDWKGRNDQI